VLNKHGLAATAMADNRYISDILSRVLLQWFSLKNGYANRCLCYPHSLREPERAIEWDHLNCRAHIQLWVSFQRMGQ
jgi:hypothetical protein